MDTKNASKWLKGPLPPLAESTLTSGLISNKTVKDGSISCKVKLTESQNIKLTNQTENFPKPKLRSSSTVSSSLMMNDIPRPSRSQQSFEKIPFSNPCKTHTIEEIVENPQKHYKLKEAPIISSKHHSNIKDLTNTVIHELDSNLANLMLSNADLENTLLNQIDYKDKMIQIYNFTFNQIILQEKSIYSERALLLRRLMEFYNSLVSELDNIQKNVKLQEEFFINVTKKLESEKSEMIQLLKDKIKNEEVLQQNIELLENKNKILNDESNNKDIQISSTSYEIDFLKGQIMQLQFKIQNKKENKKLLQNAISQRDDESKKQLQQIESLTKVIEEFHQGETGYIQKYHDKCKEIEMFKLEIEKLKKEIYDFSHKERYDVAIDTEDLPKKEIKKSSIQKDSNLLPQKEATTGVTQIKSFFRPRQSLPSAMNNRENNWNLAELMKPQQQSNEEPIIKPKINDSDSYLLQKPQKKAISRISTQQHIPSVNSLMKKRSSKEKIASLSSGVSTESLSFPTESYFDFVQKSNASIQTSPRLLETSEEKEATNSNSLNKNDIFHTSQKYIVDIDNYEMKIDKILFIQPPNYNVDHQKVSDIPDLLSIIIPFLSRPYIAKHLTDMKILDNSSVHNIVKNEKPLVWGLQLIHNFFLDPFIRANENLNRASIEVIFTDWITRQYNLQHLVNQVIADFGYLLLRNYGTSKMMAFFYEILEGRYTITQLSFIATLYSFSMQYTHPCLPEGLEKMQASDDDYDIHIVVAAKIFAKCFTAEISDSFLLPLVNKENPMLNYFDFLRRATDFFGEKHKIIFSQTRDLLWICGCLDPQYIGFDTFVAFVTFLDYDCDMRKEWKSIMSISEKHENNTITIGDLMGYLADRKQQFLRLLNLIPMGKSILTLKSYSTIINDLFLDLMNRFIRVKRQAKSKLSQAINDKIHRYLIDLKQSILCADLPRILWFYRTILLKIDKNLMKEKGSIPFNSKANSEVIKQLVEYYDRTESVAFALM